MYQEKIIAEYPAYKITNDGRVLSCFKPNSSTITEEWRELKQVYDKSCGYMIVTLCKGNGQGRQNKRVHRLMMEAFVPNPHNYSQINHKDGNKLNNSLDNLEWCTPKYNSQHSWALGISKPTNEKVVVQLDDNFNSIAEYPSLHEAGRQTGIVWQNISKVCLGLRTKAGGFRWKYK